MPKSSEAKSINLLEPMGPPSDAWTAAYNWVSKIGRYLLVSIEIIVLTVFFARFFLDKINNDLTDEINDKVDILSNETLRNDELKYRNMHLLFSDINKLNDNQPTNSTEVSSVTSSVPKDLTLDKFSFNSGRFSLTLLSTDFEAIKDYEFALRQNPKYSDVNVTISKTGQTSSDIEVAVSFVLTSSVQEDGE
jgi:hypothetical protein